jgi:hypothetical protein
LAQFMVNLSGNLSCWHPITVRNLEIVRAVEKHLLGTETLAPIRPHLVRWGLDAAAAGRELGIVHDDPYLQQLANEALREPEISIASLVHAFGQDTIEEGRRRDAEGLAGC